MSVLRLLFTNTLCYPYGYLDLLQCVLRSTANQLCHSLLEGAGFWLSHKETVLGLGQNPFSFLASFSSFDTILPWLDPNL